MGLTSIGDGIGAATVAPTTAVDFPAILEGFGGCIVGTPSDDVEATSPFSTTNLDVVDASLSSSTFALVGVSSRCGCC